MKRCIGRFFLAVCTAETILLCCGCTVGLPITAAIKNYGNRRNAKIEQEAIAGTREVVTTRFSYSQPKSELAITNESLVVTVFAQCESQSQIREKAQQYRVYRKYSPRLFPCLFVDGILLILPGLGHLVFGPILVFAENWDDYTYSSGHPNPKPMRWMYWRDVRKADGPATERTRALKKSLGKRSVSRMSVDFDCGPAGIHIAKTDDEGFARLDIKPLLFRLTKDYDWTIKATVKLDGKEYSSTKTVNTSTLGVTWDKPKFQPDLPPKLEADVVFKDPNKNKVLDADETAEIVVTVKNTGRGDAYQILLKPELPKTARGIKVTNPDALKIDHIPAGGKASITLKIKAEEEIPAQRLRLALELRELNGFEPAPLALDFASRPYAPPQLAIAKWVVDDDNVGMSQGNGNGKLEKGEQAEVTVYVQNLGKGSADGAGVLLRAGDSNIFVKSLNNELGEIPPGEWRKGVFTLRVNNRYSGKQELPLTLIVGERRAKFDVTQKMPLTLGKTMAQPKIVAVEAITGGVAEVEIKPLPELASRPKVNLKDLDLSKGTRHAVLIGIDQYLDPDVRALQYAERDVKALHEVLTGPGGYAKKNVFLMTPSAEQPQDRPTRDNILLTLKWLSENLKPEDSLLLAFCGHGDVEKGKNFLIPQNGRKALLRDTSIELSRLWEFLDACPARRQVVMLDACHSGGLAKNERGVRGMQVVTKAFEADMEKAAKAEGRAVLSSCSRDEVSYEDEKLKHGIFTYYILDGLRKANADRDKDGSVTVYELGVHVKTQVQDWCRENRKSPSQTPRLSLRDLSGEIEILEKKE